MRKKMIIISIFVLVFATFLVAAVAFGAIDALIDFLTAEPIQDSVSRTQRSTSEAPPSICPVTQPKDEAFIPPSSFPSETPSQGEFWYGSEDLWTMLRTDGTWSALPYHEHQDGEGHYIQKIFWWNKDYDWQTEEKPNFTVTGRRLDGFAPEYVSSEATNAYTPEFGSAILTGIEVPTLGCWKFTGSYKGYALSFVVWVTQ